MRTTTLALTVTTSIMLLSSSAAASITGKESGPAPRATITAKPANCRPMPEGATVGLDFRDASLGDFVDAVSRVLCRNFTVDRRLADAPLFLASPAQVRVGDLWPTFLSILGAHGATIVEGGALVAVVPAVDATRSAVPFYGPDEEVPPGNRMITKVIAVRGQQDVNAIANFLNIFKSHFGQIHAFAERRILVVTDYADNVARVGEILRQLDGG